MLAALIAALIQSRPSGETEPRVHHSLDVQKVFPQNQPLALVHTLHLTDLDMVRASASPVELIYQAFHHQEMAFQVLRNTHFQAV